MKEQRADLFLLYHQKREWVIRFWVLGIVGFVFLASISRGEDFAIHDPFQLFEGGFDSGYVIVFGSVAILLVVLWFERAVRNCGAFGNALLMTVKEGKCGEPLLNPLEETLLVSPFHVRRTSRSSRALAFLIPRTFYLVAFICCLALLWEYFQLAPSKGPTNGWRDVIFGNPYFCGFEPKSERFPKMNFPWVYPPWYTLVNVVIAAYLLARLFSPVRAQRTIR